MHKVRNVLFFTTYSKYMSDEFLLFLINWEIALQGLLWNDDKWVTASLFVQNDGCGPCRSCLAEKMKICSNVASCWILEIKMQPTVCSLHVHIRLCANLPFIPGLWIFVMGVWDSAWARKCFVCCVCYHYNNLH